MFFPKSPTSSTSSGVAVHGFSKTAVFQLPKTPKALILSENLNFQQQNGHFM